MKSRIGPFFIDGVTIREEKLMADILSKQYENICSVPMEDIMSLSFNNTKADKRLPFQNIV